MKTRRSIFAVLAVACCCLVPSAFGAGFGSSAPPTWETPQLFELGGQQSLVALDTVKVKAPQRQGDPRHPRITFGSLNANGFSFGFLSDGKKGYGSVAFGVLNNFAHNISLNAMTAYDTNGKNLYAGMNVSWKLYDRGGISAALIGGLRGLALTGGGNLADIGKPVAGFQITGAFQSK